MKYLIVLALLLVVCQGNLVKRHLVIENISEECRKESGLGDTEVKTLKGDENLSEAQKCLMKCMVQKSGYIDADGNIQVEKMATDELGDGPEDRTKKVKKCMEDLEPIKTCGEITGLMGCFRIH